MDTNDPTPSAINGDTRLFFIIGDPISQVGSPLLFNSLFQQYQIAAAMLPCHVLPADLSVVIKGLRRQQNLGGIIVTVPHKIRVLRLIDSLTPKALATGAVNAIRRNTDGSLTARLVYELFNNSAPIFATNQYSSLAQAEPAEL